MAEAEPLTEHPHPVPVPGWLVALCRWFAVIGGLVLLGMMIMTVVSVTRRTLFGAPIPGDFEMVELGSAIAVFCFLPWCQITGGNVLVDFFTMKSGPRTNHLLEALGDLTARARTGDLSPGELTGGTFTLRNSEPMAGCVVYDMSECQVCPVYLESEGMPLACGP